MEYQINKPSGEDGLEKYLGNAIDKSEYTIPPDIYATHYLKGWTYLETQVIEEIRSPEISFPLDAFPKVMKDAIEEATSFFKCPIPIASSIALGAVSASTQGQYDVSVDGRVFPTSLYFLTVAKSGERKSSTDKPFLKPFDKWEWDKKQEFNQNLKAYKSKLKAYEISVKNAYKQGTQNQHFDDDEPEKPNCQSILADRVTTEKLLSNLAINPCAYLNSNEGGAVMGGYAFKSENFQSTITTLNQLWDGRQIKHDTKGGGEIVIPNPRLTILLQIQPSIYENFINANDNLAFSTGLLNRFLISYPKSNIGERLYEKLPTGLPKVEEFNIRISEFLAKPAKRNEQGILEPKVLPLNEEAFELWRAFHDEIESQLGERGEFYLIQGWGSKAPEQVARLATNFQVISYPESVEVEKESIERAIQVIGYYLQEALRLSKDSRTKDVGRVLDWLINHLKGTGESWIVAYKIRQRIHNDLRDSERIDRALSILEDRGFIQSHIVQNKTHIFINPHCLVTI